ncbi:MAG: hypothetical protein UY70_C0014G0006 [Candidatus Kaiserbacteria bacterium GW2011_GWB1_52_6]|uniref:Uncharacterized protein n=2 Tax=Candidatus Kaiseribacteriota TaxID=1752734 RepID=A0A0G1X8S1_9BACT|nr:MAG: hypothetical protein UY67_C0011G0026 [Candidatus Kaiserbacteria bacterium GW2011_GWA2_52_12]KKW27441.1 MAG: hypothetical protein UY70_C0014G0006 [Candidatus Kaiserbacteria bacterium GW2011_GWB1_52_6]
MKLFFKYLQWRFSVRRNRARYPDLLAEEKAGRLFDFDIVIIHEMLARRRDELRNQGVGPADARYPDMFDFRSGSYKYFREVVLPRRAACKKDFDALAKRNERDAEALKFEKEVTNARL